MAKRTKKTTSRSSLKLEALEQRQLLAGGFTSAQGQEFADIQHPNGNVYDQVLLKSSSITVTNDPGQITRVSFLDLSGDIVQAEFSGAGSLTISLDADTFKAGVAPENYNQNIQYVQGLASFTISGSNETTNFSVFSVGSATPFVNTSLFSDTKTGGNNYADVARLTIVADPSAPNGSVFGGIRAGNAIFSDDSGTVGIAAANVHVQGVVRVADINATGNAIPVLTFGTLSQFGAVEVLGGDLTPENGKAYSNTGSYNYGLVFAAGTTSAGAVDAAESPTANDLSFTGTNPLNQQQLGKTLSMSAGVDNLTGSTGNDVFVGNSDNNGTVFFTSLDKIDGGAGTDTLRIVATIAIDTTTAINTSVAGIENVELQSTSTVTANTSNWAGVTNLTALSFGGANLTAANTTAVTLTDNQLGTGTVAVSGGNGITVTAIGQTTGTVSLTGSKGVVSVSATGDYSEAAAADVNLGDISVTGGSSVDVTHRSGITTAESNAAKTDTTNFSVNLGDIAVTGDSTTTTVTVTQDAAVSAKNSDGGGATNGKIGVVNGKVTVNDVNRTHATNAGVISSVTLNNFGAGSSIDSSALSTVTLTGTGSDITLSRGNLSATPTSNTLTLNISGLSGATIIDGEAAADDGFKTLDINATGSNSTIADLQFADATTINVSGNKTVTFEATTNIGNVTAINVTNTSGVSFNGTTLAPNVLFTGGSGADTVKLGATTQAITTGAGNDTVNLTVSELGSGGSIDAGEGTDTLRMSATVAAAASATTAFENTITGFERLNVDTAPSADTEIKLNNLDDINYVTIAGVDTGKTLTLSSANSGMTLVANSGANGTVAVSLANATSNDVLNVNISADNASRTIAKLDASGFETLNFNTDNSNNNPSAKSHVVTTLVGTSISTINVSGDAGLTIGTATGLTSLSSFNAVDVTKGSVSITTDALTVAATLTGGAGDDTLNAALSTKAVTINGGGGADNITGSLTVASTLNGGDGNDTLTGGRAGDTIDGGAGSDTFVANLFEAPGASTTVGAVINLSADTLTQSGVFTATGNFLASAAPSVASGSATYLFDGESSTNAVIVDTLISIENATGTTGNDYIVGSAGANVLNGGDGNDVIAAGDGDDTIDGGAGTDTINAGAGNDTIRGGAGADTITTGSGSDTVVMTHTTSVDTVTDFTRGSGGDTIAFDLSDLAQTFKTGGNTTVAAGAAVVKEASAAFTLGATENVVVLTGVFANAADVETALEAGGTRAMTWNANPDANADFVVVWTDGTDTYVSVVNDADSGDNTAVEANDLTVTNVTKLSGINSIAAGNFVSGNFTFVV